MSSTNVLEKDFEDVHLPTLLKKITDLYSLEENVQITYPDKGHLKKVNKAALSQVFMNLISNALKYNNKNLTNLLQMLCHKHSELIDNLTL